MTSTPSDPTAQFDLQSFLPYRLNVLAGLISRRLSEVYSERFGISVPEWRVLAHLTQESEISIRELHLRIDMDKAKTTRATQRLCEKNLVTRRENERDRRLVVLSLTEEGKATVTEIIALATAFEAELLSAIPDRDRKALSRVLDSLGDRLA